MFLEAGLLTRRSVRQFEKDREIPQSDIDDIRKLPCMRRQPAIHSRGSLWWSKTKK